MVTTIYLVRHCEALGNKSGTFQGSIDSDITEIGAKQLEFLGERFKNIRIDKVYSSPLKRAFKTALAIAQKHSLDIIIDKGLTEIDGGDIEGMTYAEIYEKYPDLEYSWTFSPKDFAPPNGENMQQTYQRISDTVSRLVEKNKGKTIAIASHGGVIRCLLCHLRFGTIEKLLDVIWSDNTAVAKLVFDDGGRCAIEYINDSSHVPEEYMPSGSKIASFIQVGEK